MTERAESIGKTTQGRLSKRRFRIRTTENKRKPSEPLRMPAVKPPVSDVVDGRRVGVAGVVPDAEGEVAECEAVVVTNEAEDHAELAVRRWQVGLEAGGQLRAVAVLGIAGAQGLDLCPVALEPLRASRSALAPARPLRIVSSA